MSETQNSSTIYEYYVLTIFLSVIQKFVKKNILIIKWRDDEFIIKYHQLNFIKGYGSNLSQYLVQFDSLV